MLLVCKVSQEMSHRVSREELQMNRNKPPGESNSGRTYAYVHGERMGKSAQCIMGSHPVFDASGRVTKRPGQGPPNRL